MIENLLINKLEINNSDIKTQNTINQNQGNLIENNIQFLFQIYAKKQKKIIIKNNNFIKCIVCKKQGKYTCPKCLVKYCSINHYKTHNLYCSQQFYKSNVQNQLKKLKISKEQKDKTLKILEKYQNQQYQQENIQTITQQRFQQLLKKLEQNQQIKLTYRQQQQFAQFIKIWIKQKQQKQFWQIQDGLSQLFLQTNLEIQQYNNSQYPDLIIYRKLLKQKLNQLISFDKLVKSIQGYQFISPKIIYHIFCIIYSGCLLYRYFDSQCQLLEFQIYFSKLSSIVIPTSKHKINQINTIQEGLIFMKNIALQIDSDLKSWFQIALNDTKIILKNKYLHLEMLFRLMQIYTNTKSSNKKKHNIKIIKKLQYLCSFVNEYWNKESYKIIKQQIIQQIERVQQSKQKNIKMYNQQ